MGFGSSIHPNYEQIDIIVGDNLEDQDTETYHNYLLKEVTPIAAYKCPDGSIFEDEDIAKEYTKDYNIKRKLKHFCDRNCTYDMNANDVFKALVINLNELKEILGGK